jgi:hypothetical protein
MVKKDKIFELKIEEDDELSGVDAVSLVDEPAIEINWVAFNKTHEDFVIPDGEDIKFSSMITSVGQSEQDLFDDGYELVSEDFISSSPNAPSFEDTEERLIRYKYVINPQAGGAPIVDTTREFCRDLLQKNFVYRVEDLERITNDLGSSAMVWRGSYNCRHLWKKIEYRRGDKIVNKASVTKGRIDGAESLDVMGLPQPDTRVPGKASFGYDNPLPSYVDEVSGDTISKSLVEPTMFEDVNVDVYGYKTKYFQICPGAQATFLHLISMDNDDNTIGMIRSAAVVADSIFKIEADVLESKLATPEQLKEAIVLVDDFKDIINEVDKISGMKHDVSYMDGHIETIKSYVKQNMESYSDYPDAVKNNAKAVLKYVEENGWGSCGTPVGKVRANQLANGEPISLETVKRMYSYLSRHEADLEASKGYDDGCGKLMYDSWGGKSALSWSKSKINQAEKMSKQYFQIDNDEKRVVLGPAMVPHQNIFRKDAMGNPYYVFFSPETIRMIAEKYMKNQYTRNNDLMHDGKAVKDVYVIESWIKEDDQDKSIKYGYEDLPKGTWFVAMKIAKTPMGDKVWNQVKEGKLNGFSVSGFFEEVQAFSKEEMFLYKVAEILKKY